MKELLCVEGTVVLFYPRKTNVFGVYWNQPVCPSVHVSICVQDTTLCQSAGRNIKYHLVTVLVYL